MIGFYLSLIDDPEEKPKFEQLYAAYSQEMFKLAYGILKNKFDAEDAVHNAFVSVIKNMDKVGEVGSGRTHGYVLITAKNAALKIHNAKSRITDTGSNDITDDVVLEDSIISDMEAERLKLLLEYLPEDYYDILYLHLFMGLEIREISEHLGISYDNAKKRLQRAKRKFRDLLEET
ncbi:MAG: sigma-70 family RNA polymerase sigma factor [Ruminococcus sp.]|nr:sigma-70 family RNA polymerase sigma factor [Ruminococcus sp.]